MPQGGGTHMKLLLQLKCGQTKIKTIQKFFPHLGWNIYSWNTSYFKFFLLSTLVCQAPSLLSLLVQKSKSSFGNPLFWKINYQLDFSHNSSFFCNFLMTFPAGPQRRQTIGADNSMKIKFILSTQFAELKLLKLLTLKKHLFSFGEKIFKVWQVLSLPFPDSTAITIL